MMSSHYKTARTAILYGDANKSLPRGLACAETDRNCSSLLVAKIKTQSRFPQLLLTYGI